MSRKIGFQLYISSIYNLIIKLFNYLFFGGLSRIIIPRSKFLTIILSSQDIYGFSLWESNPQITLAISAFLRRESLLYTNLFKSRSVLHRTMTGLESEW